MFKYKKRTESELVKGCYIRPLDRHTKTVIIYKAFVGELAQKRQIIKLLCKIGMLALSFSFNLLFRVQNKKFSSTNEF